MSKHNLIYLLIGASLLLMVLDKFGFLRVVHDLGDNLVIPIKSVAWNARVNFGEFYTILTKYGDLKNKFEELRQKEREVTEINLKYELLVAENEKLRLQLASPLPPSYKFIPALVLKSGLEMEIDVGGSSGVKSGMTVVSGTVVLGKVVSVSNRRSKIMTLLNPATKAAVITDSGASGVAVGGGTSIFIENILQKEPLFLGDKVKTAGTDDFPPNLLIGKIAHIEVDDAAVYKKATVEPAVDFGSLRYVFVLSDL